MDVRFTREESANIIDLATNSPRKHSTTIFKDTRIDYFYYTLKRDLDSQWVFTRIKLFLDNLYPNNIADTMNEMYVHEFPSGCRFVRHRDNINYPDQMHIVGACLNDDYQGGEFIAYDPDETFKKEAGVIYQMAASREHEVLEVLSGTRWSMIQFFNKEHLKIPNNSII